MSSRRKSTSASILIAVRSSTLYLPPAFVGLLAAGAADFALLAAVAAGGAVFVGAGSGGGGGGLFAAGVLSPRGVAEPDGAQAADGSRAPPILTSTRGVVLLLLAVLLIDVVLLPMSYFVVRERLDEQHERRELDRESGSTGSLGAHPW